MASASWAWRIPILQHPLFTAHVLKDIEHRCVRWRWRVNASAGCAGSTEIFIRGMSSFNPAPYLAFRGLVNGQSGLVSNAVEILRQRLLAFILIVLEEPKFDPRQVTGGG